MFLRRNSTISIVIEQLKLNWFRPFYKSRLLILTGYYADPEADCQAFHICTADGQGGLSKYSFLCPNGTVFNQNYFICDWWFNFDCSTAEELYSLNEDIAAEREANSPEGAADAPLGSYGAEGAGDSYAGPGDQANYDGEVRAGRSRGRQGRRFRG